MNNRFKPREDQNDASSNRGLDLDDYIFGDQDLQPPGMSQESERQRPAQGASALQQQLADAMQAQERDDESQATARGEQRQLNPARNLDRVVEDPTDVYGSYANNTMEAILKKNPLTPQQEAAQKQMSQTPKPESMRKKGNLKPEPIKYQQSERSKQSSKTGMYNTNVSRRDTNRKNPPRRENRSVVSGTNRSELSNLVAVGADKKREQEEMKVMAPQDMQRLLGTEYIIDKVLKMLDTNPWDDLGNWPADCVAYKGMKLSESKMKATVDDREPRTVGSNGALMEYPLFGTNLGYHSTERANRKSEIEELGEGTNLYFKFLKYFMLLFLWCTLLSGPAITFYAYGMQYDQVDDPVSKMIGLTTVGNLGPYREDMCSSGELPDTRNQASYVTFRCTNDKVITGLKHFGLAFQNETCTGHGSEKSVRTIDRCTYGNMGETIHQEINTRFIQNCVGKKVCSMFVDYQYAFSPDCQREIKKRQAGKSPYGPAKVYAIAECEIKTVKLGNVLDLDREIATLIIVCLDCFIMLMVSICIIRLRWYEKVSVNDMKQGKLRLEDFTITLPTIPISKKDYGNNPDLLTAQICTHFESVVAYELQCIQELQAIQQSESEIVNVSYGYSSFTTMSHIVEMFKECEKIADLRKKIQVDPQHTREYEAIQWMHYTRITELNDDYYEEKARIQKNNGHSIKNAFITFRSMEGKERCIRAFEISWFQRYFIANCCCLDGFFRRKKLLQKGFPAIREVVDPQTVIWENLGVSFAYRFNQNMKTIMVIVMTLFASFWGFYYFQTIEKDLVSMVRSDCQGESSWDIDIAWLDNQKPYKYKLGEMNCYCKHIFDQYGERGLKVIFADGQQYCKDWHYVFIQGYFTGPAIGAWIAVGNIFITVILQKVMKKQREKDSSAYYEAVTFAIFFTQYINTSVIILLAMNSFVQTQQLRLQNSKMNFLVGPFDEFNSGWYLRIGTAIAFAQGAMLVFPHIFTLLQSIFLGLRRCSDRRFSWNTKKTSKIIQSEYEDLYTGPEWILHVRYAQLLATIFTTFTYSPGMPALYALTFVIFFVQFWVDKWLVFNFYRKTPQFTKFLSASVVKVLPLAVFVHALFGLIMFSYQAIFRSTVITPWFGNYTQYFSKERLGQTHVAVFTIVNLLIVVLFMFEESIVYYWRKLAHSCTVKCGSCFAKMNGKEYEDADWNNQGFVYSDDLFFELNYGQLYRLYQNGKKEKQRIKLQKFKNTFTQKEVAEFVDPYLKILERNQEQLFIRLRELAEEHEQHLAEDERELDMMTDDQRVTALYNIYSKATDKGNAESKLYASKLKLAAMNGRVMNQIQSFEYLENEKYSRIEKLLLIMKETFGFEDPADDQEKGTKKDDKRPDSGETSPAPPKQQDVLAMNETGQMEMSNFNAQMTKSEAQNQKINIYD